jgi:hypothetical protein
MSGFEPVVAQAAAAEVGTAALASEVMASNALAAANMAAYTPAAVGAMSAVPAGLGALASAIPGMYEAGSVATGALGGGVPTFVEQLATTSPEVLGQLQNTLRPAMFEGLNTTALETLTPEQIAQTIGGIPTVGPGTEIAYATNNLVNSGVTPDMLDPNVLQQAVPDLTPEQLKDLRLENDVLAEVAGKYPRINPQGDPLGGLGGLGDVFKGLYKDFSEMEPKNKLLYGGVASLAAPTIMGMLKKKKEPEGATPYDGPLSKFRYDPAQYVPQNINPPTPYKRRYAQGGLSDLGGYSDYARGGRMLKGPGDGMSDNIPATIAGKQPARLANEEFVIPADVVSHLGNGSSEAGAKQLYKMMDRVRQARTGSKKQGKQIKADKYLA